MSRLIKWIDNHLFQFVFYGIMIIVVIFITIYDEFTNKNKFPLSEDSVDNV